MNRTAEIIIICSRTFIKTWYNNTDFNTTILSSLKSDFRAKRETGERPVQSCYCKCVVFSVALYRSQTIVPRHEKEKRYCICQRPA